VKATVDACTQFPKPVARIPRLVVYTPLRFVRRGHGSVLHGEPVDICSAAWESSSISCNLKAHYSVHNSPQILCILRHRDSLYKSPILFLYNSL
jgi:hypothetical protein